VKKVRRTADGVESQIPVNPKTSMLHLHSVSILFLSNRSRSRSRNPSIRSDSRTGQTVRPPLQYYPPHLAIALADPRALADPMSTSRSQHLLGLIRALPPTPLRPAGSPQLSNALEGVANRITKVRGEEGVEGMVGALERIQAGKAMAEVSDGRGSARSGSALHGSAVHGPALLPTFLAVSWRQ
jgi:hypothetical protein